MQQHPLDYKPPIGDAFIDAIRQARHLKNIKSQPVKRWQEGNIIQTLLAGLRGK